MNRRLWLVLLPGLLGALLLIPMLGAQPDFPPFGPGGPRGPGGPGQVRKLVKQFDKDGDGKLNKDERQAARAFLKKERTEGGLGDRGGRRFGPPPGFGRDNQEPAKPGPRV